jgi:hypothetical protein
LGQTELPEGETCADDEEFEKYIKEIRPVMYTVLPDSFIKFDDFEKPLHSSMLYPHSFGIQFDLKEVHAVSYFMETSEAKFRD